jgi:phage terminase large subunit
MQQNLTPQQMVKMRAYFRYHPEWFFKHWLGMELYDKQVEICNSVVHNRTTSVASCNSAGKTGTSGGIVPWFLLSWDESIVVSTAPTYRQVKDLLWSEINTRWEKAKYPLSADKPNVVGWQIAPNWFAVGVSSKDPNRVQGYHADSGHILVIADEAAGIDQLMFEGFHAILTSEHARFLMLGNPTSQNGEFRDSHKPGSLAHRIRIDAFETPNFTANNIRNEDDLRAAIESKRELAKPYPSLISPIWVYERLKKWGGNSPMYQSRVRARFPEVGENNLIPLNWIEKACSNERLEQILGLELTDGDDAQEKANELIRQEKLAGYIAAQNTSRGVDVARFGSDATIVQPRWGAIVGRANAWHKMDTMQTAGRVWPLIENKPTDITGVDVIGVGAGVVDRLHELQSEQEAQGIAQWAQIIGVNVAEKPTAKPEGMAMMDFANKRAELYWTLREKFERGDIYLTPDENGNPPEELMDELSSIQYKFIGGKIYIEEKAEMKKRLQKSPDRSDALMLSYTTGNGLQWDTKDESMSNEDDADYEPTPGGAENEYAGGVANGWGDY